MTIKAHYIYAHPTVQSFNAALFDIAERKLKQTDSTLIDLYRSHFKSVANWDDFLNPESQKASQYGLAQLSAQEHHALSKDIQQELENIKNADFLIFQFPLWWFSAPAILKGWIDRVLVKGATYESGAWFSGAPLAGKKALIIVTTQSPESAFSENGLHGSIRRSLYSIHQALRFVGFSILEPYVLYGVGLLTEEERALAIDQFDQDFGALHKRIALPFPAIDQFNKKLQLLDGAIEW